MGCTLGCTTRDHVSQLTESKDFKGKVVIVTDATSGLGATIALKLTDQGAHLVLVSQDSTKLDKLAIKCSNCGDMPLTLIADLTDLVSVNTIIQETIEKYGKLDVLVNNRTSDSRGMIETSSMSDFDEIFKRNLRGAVQMIKKAIPYLAETKGNIVSVITVMNDIKDEQSQCQSNSWAVKAALDHFSKCIAAEFAPQAIRVNLVHSGPMLTDEEGTTSNKNKLQNSLSKTLLHTVSETDDLADIIIFLASDKAKSVTGVCWVSDNHRVKTESH